MKCKNLYSRTLRVTDLPARIDGLSNALTELTITIRYTDDGGSPLDKAIVLDHVIMPAIIRALNTSK